MGDFFVRRRLRQPGPADLGRQPGPRQNKKQGLASSVIHPEKVECPLFPLFLVSVIMRSLNTFRACTCAILALCCVAPVHSDGACGSLRMEYVTWNLPIAVPRSATKETLALVKELKELLNQRVDIGQPTVNPLCCLWIEVGGTAVWPYPEGYLIVIGSGGGRILASSEAELRKASRELVSLARKEPNGSVKLPLGIITNFPTNRIIQRDDEESN